ncbi:MAG: prepilin peptidase [bacterium]
MTYFFLITVLLLGLAIGSFVNSLAWRLYKAKTLKGRSVCPTCGHNLAWYDNIPLLSFVLLKAKCRYCSQQISWQYPLVEFMTAILFALAFYYNPLFPDFATNDLTQATLLLIRNWLLIVILTTIFVMDLRWYVIVDKVSLPASAIILAINLYLGLPWQNLALAGIIGGSFFLLQFVVSKGKWIGGGDIRLGLLMGVALGWPQVAVALFLAYILGSIYGVLFIILGKKDLKAKVPFGTFLSLGTLITLFWGQQILNWYLGLIL